MNDALFIIAIALLPFDNLFFAPSSGWATISPIIMFIYVLCNYKHLLSTFKKYKYLLAIVFICLIFSIIAFFIYGFNFNAVFDSLATLSVGLAILFSFDIYVYQKNNKFDRIIKLLIISYSISIAIGWIQYIAMKFNIEWIINLISFFSKRNYILQGRVQFSFTEPSFIGMHLFGILLPMYFISKNRKILILIIIFSLCAIFFNSSVRFLLDAIIILAVMTVVYLIRNKKILILISSFLIFLIGIIFLYFYNDRVRNILNNGVYADDSFASRYFRIEASVYGYLEKPSNLVIGYGMGNSIIPLHIGYDKAYKNYKNDYMDEVIMLGNKEYNDQSATFCLYTRLISEYGIIIFLIIAISINMLFKNSIFKYKLEFLLIILYLYLQFDSYAFYTFWLFILIMKNTNKVDGSNEDFNIE